MEPIEISGLFSDGWNLFVPRNRTIRFLEHLRDKVSFTVDVSAISGGLEPKVDIFAISDQIPLEKVKEYILDFEIIENRPRR